MLKITTVDAPNQRKLVLEGMLVEPWLQEFRRVWEDARQSNETRKLIIDLKNVTVISQEGRDTLSQIMSEGVQITGCGVHTKHVVRQVARTCKAAPRQK